MHKVAKGGGVAAMSDAFDTILGQPQVRDYLRAAVLDSHVTHAYLFAGAPGSNKTQAAIAFARALLCPKGASGPRGGKCGACDVCERVARRVHPDIHEVFPEGTGGYLIEQIRDLNADAARKPNVADKSVYIIHQAEKLGTSCANAFLKTLEEPHSQVVFILLGRDRASVLPTIASRCQIVAFRHIPPEQAAGIVAQNTGCDVRYARAAIDAAAGSITGAIEFLKAPGNKQIAFRNKLLTLLPALAGPTGPTGPTQKPTPSAFGEIFDQIAHAGDYGVVLLTRAVMDDLKAPLDDLLARQAADLEANRDFYSPSILRRIEARNKRQLSADTLKLVKQALAMITSWLRDVSYCATDCADLMVNVDFKPDIFAFALRADITQIAGAIAAIQGLSATLDYNVSTETCINCALLRLKEVINCANCTGQPSL